MTSGAGVGTDCAVLTFGEGYDTVISTTPVTAPTEDISTYAIPMSLNNIAAAGAEPVGVMLAVELPERRDKRRAYGSASGHNGTDYDCDGSR